MPDTKTIIARSPPADGQNWECQCARCGSSCDYEHCDECDEGFRGHDCGEDCCMCLHPEDNVLCDVCDGNGGWWRCLSSSEWCNANPAPGREDVPRGRIEWFLCPEGQQ